MLVEVVWKSAYTVTSLRMSACQKKYRHKYQHLKTKFSSLKMHVTVVFRLYVRDNIICVCNMYKDKDALCNQKKVWPVTLNNYALNFVFYMVSTIWFHIPGMYSILFSINQFEGKFREIILSHKQRKCKLAAFGINTKMKNATHSHNYNKNNYIILKAQWYNNTWSSHIKQNTEVLFYMYLHHTN